MMAKDSKDSPSLLQYSHSAANDSGDPSASARKKGCLPCLVRCHSNHPLAGSKCKHRRERNASPNKGLVWTVSARALTRCVLIRLSLDQAGTSPQRSWAMERFPSSSSRQAGKSCAGAPLQIQRQRRSPQAVQIVNLTPGQLQGETATHR